MGDKEFERAEIRELCRSGVVMLAARARESMVRVRVIVNRRFRIERGMNLRLRFGRAKLVEPSDMQHQRAVQVLRFIKTLLDADAVITNRRIRLEAHRQQVCEISAEAKT